MSYCICCNSSLLRHIRHGEVYLYCPDCRQEMPEADSCGADEVHAVLSNMLFRPLVVSDAEVVGAH
ncbi:hypothetical protein SPB21_09110 [Leptothoe sp. ISB3NOV94-8A]|uniref:hypothetical protein n=1 Tax=Adonisia turfae TaxID=2950184 RepID=UPI0013D00648|nr:hypothetical protein [Adonisia turfae]MDV3348942.1 hypothetical protein [Leptothoe sp. LEGE 181152]